MPVSDKLPSAAGKVASEYPAVWQAHAALGKATAEAGPLDQRTRRLVKLALAIGASSEGAVHSHTRRGIDEGLSPKKFLKLESLIQRKALVWINDIKLKG